MSDSDSKTESPDSESTSPDSSTTVLESISGDMHYVLEVQSVTIRGRSEIQGQEEAKENSDGEVSS
ncbi:MAG TPA: hypothetical protein VJK02_21120 [Anaerolineales bacterium]|nr:hypothetical protein [Anaerolineales bacterium]